MLKLSQNFPTLRGFISEIHVLLKGIDPLDTRERKLVYLAEDIFYMIKASMILIQTFVIWISRVSGGSRILYLRCKHYNRLMIYKIFFFFGMSAFYFL